MLSPDRLARVTVDSFSLWERFACGFRAENPPEPATIESRLKAWRRSACQDDESLFVERLARDGLDIESLRPLLGPVKIPADFCLPAWCDVLNRVLETAQRLSTTALSSDAAQIFPYLDPEDPLPFEELFLPFVEVGRELFAEGGPSTLPSHVANKFARDLLQRLIEVAARPLAVEFRAFLASHQLDNTTPVNTDTGPRSRVQYRLFIAKIYEGGGWETFFEEYCVASRLLTTALMQWAGNFREFEHRLSNDRAEIERLLNHPLGGVLAVETGLSDPHNGGRTAISIEFSSGRKIVYKPRSLGLEKAYFDFAAWINQFGTLLPLRIVKVLDRGDYGWAEFIENRSCTRDDEIRRYYRRAGHFLCFVYALGGSDFHFENLIAESEHPVPIDLETIYHPRLKISKNAIGGTDEMAARLRVSVLTTDLLPDPVKVDDQYFDISAFARSEEDEGEAELVVWKHINTDAMDYSYQRQRQRTARNLPKLNGKAVALNDYTSTILSGFEEAYRFLQEKAELLLDENGPLRAMFTHDARFIFRSTAFYSLILRRALHPAYLCNGIDFGAQLDILASDLMEPESRPATWPLLQAEMNALWKLDIPRFTARGDENVAQADGLRIAGCFSNSAWDATREKIKGLSEEDLRWQMSLIVGSFDVRSANLAGQSVTLSGADEAYAESEALGRDALITIARKLANEIEAKAFRTANGDLGWMVLHYSPPSERYTLQPMENDLYNGRAGIALFFAALESVSPGYRSLALASLRPVQSWIKTASDDELTEFGFGGYAGLSSMVYALTRAGLFLGDNDLIEDARTAALRIRPEHIDKDRSLDVISGSAGAIPALLACHAATGDTQVLARAVAYGRHLLQSRRPDKFGFKTWPTLDRAHLTGFSHGAAGISYALLQLYKVTADTAFYDAAMEGIRFEHHAFSEKESNWPDYRHAASKFPEPMFCMAWCHGAPGIGLGRIGTLDIMDTADVRRDIKAALTSTVGVNLLPRDHLCCGNAGLMDTLCEAGERLMAPEWSDKARRLAARTLARCDRRGGLSIAFENGFYNPSLFQGAAGVGYQLLRLADPKRIPSVLLLN